MKCVFCNKRCSKKHTINLDGAIEYCHYGCYEDFVMSYDEDGYS